MFRRIALAIVAMGLFDAGAASAAGDVPGGERACFDAAVVAQLVRARSTPIPDAGPDEIIMRWPWNLDLAVEQVLIGFVSSDQLRVVAILHTGFNPQIEHFLFFLQRRQDDRYVVTDTEALIVRDDRGRFVMPLVQPLDKDGLYPAGPIGGDYEGRLKPVKYRAGDAWWLRAPHLSAAELQGFDPAWARRSGAGLVAQRGLFLDDLAKSIAARPGALCKRH